MKITKRQLRRIIREAVSGTAEHGPNAGIPWIDVVMNYLAAGDTDSATQAVLDSYWVDDTWLSEEDALEEILVDAWKKSPDVQSVQDAVDSWYVRWKALEFMPKSREEREQDWAGGAEKAKARSAKRAASQRLS